MPKSSARSIPFWQLKANDRIYYIGPLFSIRYYSASLLNMKCIIDEFEGFLFPKVDRMYHLPWASITNEAYNSDETFNAFLKHRRNNLLAKSKANCSFNHFDLWFRNETYLEDLFYDSFIKNLSVGKEYILLVESDSWGFFKSAAYKIDVQTFFKDYITLFYNSVFAAAYFIMDGHDGFSSLYRTGIAFNVYLFESTVREDNSPYRDDIVNINSNSSNNISKTSLSDREFVYDVMKHYLDKTPTTFNKLGSNKFLPWNVSGLKGGGDFNAYLENHLSSYSNWVTGCYYFNHLDFYLDGAEAFLSKLYKDILKDLDANTVYVMIVDCYEKEIRTKTGHILFSSDISNVEGTKCELLYNCIYHSVSRLIVDSYDKGCLPQYFAGWEYGIRFKATFFEYPSQDKQYAYSPENLSYFPNFVTDELREILKDDIISFKTTTESDNILNVNLNHKNIVKSMCYIKTALDAKKNS